MAFISYLFTLRLSRKNYLILWMDSSIRNSIKNTWRRMQTLHRKWVGLLIGVFYSNRCSNCDDPSCIESQFWCSLWYLGLFSYNIDFTFIKENNCKDILSWKNHIYIKPNSITKINHLNLLNLIFEIKCAVFVLLRSVSKYHCK